ncbi:MAG: DUF3570 domain-containing protein [Methylococcaceae bacterium]|nr:DUF3570 domain-containing protein [Methylococcaceae bacterium]
MKANKHQEQKKTVKSALESLTAAALILPGLLQQPALAAEDDEVDFQYSHYQEGKREISGITYNLDGSQSVSTVKSFNPIEVEGLHGSAKISLTDRFKFAFNYIQDTWGGATPISTAPVGFNVNSLLTGPDGQTIVGASPYLVGTGNTYLDQNLNPVSPSGLDPQSGEPSYTTDNQLTHVMSYASPETRKQGDFKLTYEWDEAALSLGGGISLEDDYESRFGNIGGRWDFNQKQTSVNLDLSYTNSETNAVLDHDAGGYLYPVNYSTQGFDQINNLENEPFTSRLQGTRQDWATHLGLSHVLSKDAVISGDIGYTRSTGYLSNPYKGVNTVFIDPDNQCCLSAGVAYRGSLYALMEQRPEIRNQWNLGGRFVQYIQPLDAALHFDYRFSADDWGIQAHAFEADWVQPVGHGWTITPRVRYYSQDAADFYTPWLVTMQPYNQQVDANGNNLGLPYDSSKFRNLAKPSADYSSYFSSDHRLSGYGALSGGVTVSKQFAKGVSVETGFEYYTHQGSLKMGGGGEGKYGDFDYWVANAALKVNLSALSFKPGPEATGHEHGEHSHHALPAGVMFGHLLPKALQMMVGYRYQYASQSGPMLNGTDLVMDQTIVSQGCTGARSVGCFAAPSNMAMHMHMLDIMYAPTDWLTLMLMPQFMDMSMSMRSLSGSPGGLDHSLNGHLGHHLQNSHETGGIGDLGMFALVKLFDDNMQHVHVTLGLSAPTGDVDMKMRRNHQIDGGFIHYGMQLGSGTWDLKPSLTYTGILGQWAWGAQVNGTVRMEGQNESGYRLGDLFQSTAWGGYHLLPWLNASIRGVYTVQTAVHGQFNGIEGQFFAEDGFTPTSSIKFGPMDYPQNYGGRFWDIGFGLNVTIPSGDLEGNQIGVEWLQPVHTDFNGYQLDRDGALAATWSVAF